MLKPFVFDRAGICEYRCTDRQLLANLRSRGRAALASIWAFTPPAGGVFPALRGRYQSVRESARGLRNSMALAVHPQFPAEGFPILQAETLRICPIRRNRGGSSTSSKAADIGMAVLLRPGSRSPEYKAFLQTNSLSPALHQHHALPPAHSLLPPRRPLSVLYYKPTVSRAGQVDRGAARLALPAAASSSMARRKGSSTISLPPVRYHVVASGPRRCFGPGSKRRCRRRHSMS